MYRHIRLSPLQIILEHWFLFVSMIVAGYHIAEYVAVRFIPLGVSGCLFRTVLLVSVTFFARLILKEFLTVFKLTAIALRCGVSCGLSLSLSLSLSLCLSPLFLSVSVSVSVSVCLCLCLSVSLSASLSPSLLLSFSLSLSLSLSYLSLSLSLSDPPAPTNKNSPQICLEDEEFLTVPVKTCFISGLFDGVKNWTLKSLFPAHPTPPNCFAPSPPPTLFCASASDPSRHHDRPPMIRFRIAQSS